MFLERSNTSSELIHDSKTIKTGGIFTPRSTIRSVNKSSMLKVQPFKVRMHNRDLMFTIFENELLHREIKEELNKKAFMCKNVYLKPLYPLPFLDRREIFNFQKLSLI